MFRFEKLPNSSTAAALFYIPTSNVEGANLSTFSPKLIVLWFKKKNCHPSRLFKIGMKRLLILSPQPLQCWVIKLRVFLMQGKCSTFEVQLQPLFILSLLHFSTGD
ncbi:hypothetical protein H1C71_017285 [Ictidomys tridecemlineatus]|nr:hypothetical protein H1C71_017285 [Ictidomys tridecemlineatus]